MPWFRKILVALNLPMISSSKFTLQIRLCSIEYFCTSVHTELKVACTVQEEALEWLSADHCGPKRAYENILRENIY